MYLKAEDLKYLHDKEGNLSSNGVEFINTLAQPSPLLASIDKGFPKITKMICSTLQPKEEII